MEIYFTVVLQVLYTFFFSIILHDNIAKWAQISIQRKSEKNKEVSETMCFGRMGQMNLIIF